MDNNSRKIDHKKHKDLENIFPELEKLLGNTEKSILNNYSKPQKKMYLIVGCARSGSTLLFQYLSKTGYFAYPTNFLSRFYYAPYIGYRLQQALIDFDEKGEIFQKQSTQNKFSSNLGKTKGPKEAHEFWYFWNRFFKFKDLQQLNEEEINKVDWNLFLKELHAFESVANKPILMKAMNLNWNLLDLKKQIPNIHFIYIKRDIVYNAQSLLQSRKSFFGNYDDWYSFKTPNYHTIKNLPNEEQVVEQVYSNNKAIEDQLSKIDSNDITQINYLDFCESPSSVIKDLNLKGASITAFETIFKHGNIKKLPDEIFKKLNNYTKN